MNVSDFLVTIFVEHMASATIVPFLSSITLEAMCLFGTYDVFLPAVFGIAGLVVGCLLNWVFGYGLRTIHVRIMPTKAPSAALSAFMVRYGWMSAVLFWLPLASVFLVVLGFFRVSLPRILMMVTLGAMYQMKNFFLV